MATQMNEKRKRSAELPDHILFEILSWLPAKSLCIYKCCSKSFLNFINSTNFALKQSQNSLLKDDSYFFIQDFLVDPGKTNTGIHSSLPSSSSTSDQIPREEVGVPPKFLRYVDRNSISILASSNGLLLCETPLLSIGQWQLSICNPITQSHSFIPSPFCTHGFKKHYPAIIFSFDCNDNDEDYKLYALKSSDLQLPGSVVCKMYIPKEGVWKEREPRFFFGKEYLIINQLPMFYKGAIHFPILEVSRWRKYLASYNVENGVSRVIELPDGAVGLNDGNVGIFKWGEVGSKKKSICLVNLNGNRKVGCAFTVWVLSDHESSSGGNWLKILNVSPEELGLDRKCYRILGYTVINGRSLVFATETKVYDYDLSGKRETRLEIVCDHKLLPSPSVTLLPYSDTLRSCGIDSTTLRV